MSKRNSPLTGADFARRRTVFDDAIDIYRVAMAEEFPEHEGTVVSVRDMGVSPRPVQAGGPPVCVGGSSPAALRRAGECGDGWIPQGTPRTDMPAQIEQVLGHRSAAGKSEPIDLGAMAEPVYMGQPSWDIGRYSLAGSAEEHVERLNALGAMGVSHVQVKFRSRSVDELLNQMAAFGRDALPELQR